MQKEIEERRKEGRRKGEGREEGREKEGERAVVSEYIFKKGKREPV